MWGSCSEQTYVHGDEDADLVVLPPCVSLVVILLRRVVSDHQCVLGQLFVETFLGCAVEVKVQGLGDLGQGAQGHEREECPHVFCRVAVRFGKTNQGQLKIKRRYACDTSGED